MLALEWAPLSSSGLLLYQQVHYPTSEHSLYPAEGGLTAFWIHHRTPGDPSTPDTATEITRGWKKPVSGQGPSLKPEGAKNSPCSPKTESTAEPVCWGECSVAQELGYPPSPRQTWNPRSKPCACLMASKDPAGAEMTGVQGTQGRKHSEDLTMGTHEALGQHCREGTADFSSISTLRTPESDL